MVGEGVLLECLNHPDVELVLVINRKPGGVSHPKLREIIHGDFFDLAPIEPQLLGYDSCLFCLGTSSVGLSQEEYRHLTYDLTLNVGRLLAKCNPEMTFCYLTGAGTDSSERGRIAWARVKGATENALMRLFKRSYMFRPGFIEPAHGETSRTKLYRISYAVAKPLLPLIRLLFRNQILTTQQIARAMLNLVTHPYPKHILEIKDIRAAAEIPVPQRNEDA